MKKEIADKWVAALRSGEYQQAQHRLCRTTEDNTPIGFCCLGVLCDLAEHEGVVQHSTINLNLEHSEDPVAGIFVRQYFKADYSTSTLPREVQAWAGMQSNDGRRGDADPLTVVNDRGASFDVIANIIERDWETL